MFIKGEGNTACQPYEDFLGYIQDEAGYIINLQDLDDNQVKLGDNVDDCSQVFEFYDATNATSPSKHCGGDTVIWHSWLQLVSPHVLYLRLEYEVTNPVGIHNDDGSDMVCRDFLVGYLVPYEDVLDNPGLDW
jgi:hypothetical protein